MEEILEIQKLRLLILNEIIRLTNPNKTPFAGDASFMNGQKVAFSKILEEIDKTLENI